MSTFREHVFATAPGYGLSDSRRYLIDALAAQPEAYRPELAVALVQLDRELGIRRAEGVAEALAGQSTFPATPPLHLVVPRRVAEAILAASSYDLWMSRSVLAMCANDPEIGLAAYEADALVAMDQELARRRAAEPVAGGWDGPTCGEQCLHG